MRTLLLVIVVWFGCGGADQKSEPTPAPQESIETVSLRWGKAALGGNKAEAMSLSLTHAQLVELSTKDIPKAEYDEELTSFLDGLAREGKENPGGKVVATKIIERKTLPASEKVRRALDYALIRLVIEQDGAQAEAGPPLLFFRTDAGWRFSPKK